MTPALALALAAQLATPTPPAKHSKPTFDMQKVEVPLRRAAVPEPRTDTAPELTLEQLFAHQRDRIDRLALRQMPLLRRMILAADPEDPLLPDYYFRLAELCAAHYRYLEHSARSLDEPIFRAEQAERSSSAAQSPEPEQP
jgi:hypothetical protein